MRGWMTSRAGRLGVESATRRCEGKVRVGTGGFGERGERVCCEVLDEVLGVGRARRARGVTKIT